MRCVEILNPRGSVRDELVALAEKMVSKFTDAYEISTAVKRGLAYYVEDGFEISCPSLRGSEANLRWWFV
jgi:histidyl-tRNA synthetase